MKLKKMLIYGSFAILLLTVNSCKKDDNDIKPNPNPNPPNNELPDCPTDTLTYDGQIRNIVQSNCAISGCHGDGTSPGLFTTYEGMKPYLTSGLIKLRAIDEKAMPPAPAKLSDDDYLKLRCWIEAGFPEN